MLELRTELLMRGMVTAGKRKPELERDFDELRRESQMCQLSYKVLHTSH